MTPHEIIDLDLDRNRNFRLAWGIAATAIEVIGENAKELEQQAYFEGIEQENGLPETITVRDEMVLYGYLTGLRVDRQI